MIRASNLHHSVKRRRRRKYGVVFAACICFCTTFFVSNLATTNFHDTIDNVPSLDNQNTRHQQHSDHCVIHVHGLHHSGTGFTRQVLYKVLRDDASIHNHTGVTQDEGHHLQRIYPNFRKRLRFPSICGTTRRDLSTTLDRLYVCSELTQAFRQNKTIASQRLYKQWSRHWDTSKKFLIQKTPTMDIGLLELFKIHPTVHVITMRHPLSWTRVLLMMNPKPTRELETNPILLPLTWWKVWTSVLEELAKGRIQSFVVVNYEELVVHEAQVAKQLADYIERECQGTTEQRDAPNQQQQQQRRRLHLYNNTTNVTEYLAPKMAVEAYQKCRADETCNGFMDATSTILQEEFGYHWNPETPFRIPTISDMLLFTSDRRPSMDLVQRMKNVIAAF